VARPAHEPPIATTLVPAALRWAGREAPHDEVLLSPSAIEETLEELAFARGEPELGLLLPERLVFPRYGYGELAARSSSDVRSALFRLARYAPLAVPGAQGEVVGDAFHLRHVWRARRPSRVLHEFGLAHALHTLRVASGQRIRPVRVWFVHARPRDLGPLHVFFGTEDLEFGREDDGFTLSGLDLSLALVGADPRLAATMDDLAGAVVSAKAPLSYATRVAQAIALPDTTLESVGRALHASPRTVQRWLEAEGTSFSEVLDGARAALARTLLREGDLPLAEVAARVGFSDVAPFTRAFRRWTGTPPGMFRRAARIHRSA